MFQPRRLTKWAHLVLPIMFFGCGSDDASESGALEITISAEDLGANGYGFPPAAGQEVAFVDGWQVEFDRIIVAIDNIRISRVPDKDPGDQSVMGEMVAQRSGPYVVDLRGKTDAQDRAGAGKVAVRLPIDDLEGLFDLEQRYAFSFDLVAPTKSSVFVNLEKDDDDVVQMLAEGQRALLTGQATFRGTDCSSADDSYDFEALPERVDFRFAFDGGARYLNCQNPDNTGEALEGEEFQRGIQMLSNGTTTAQITIHTDHLFWPTVNHENLPLFDQFAANAKQTEDGATVELADLASVKLPGITDTVGNALPWRSCVDGSLYELPTKPTQVTFDSGSRSLSNLRDFVQHNALTMGHLNANGLCFSEVK